MTERTKATNIVLILTAVSMVLLFASALLWVVVQHAAFLHQQIMAEQSRTTAIQSVTTLTDKLASDIDKAAAAREEILENQAKILKQQEYTNTMLRKVLAAKGQESCP